MTAWTLTPLQGSAGGQFAFTALCPICGSKMRQQRRGATLKKRGPAYVCPVDESELYLDANENIKRRPGGIHPYLRVWSIEELNEVLK